jgi:hypothetical protein
MAKTMTLLEACTRFANLATTGVPIAETVQEAVDRIYEMGRYPGTTVELELAESDFVYDDELVEYAVYFDEDLYDGAVGFRNASRGWSIVDQVSLYKDGVNMGDREFVDMGTVSYGGSGSGYATVTLGTDEDNNITFTAVTPGTAGNDITVEIESSDDQTYLDILSVTNEAIVITPSGIKSIVVSGAGTSAVDGTYLPDGTNESGKQRWTKVGESPATSANSFFYVTITGKWYISTAGTSVYEVVSTSAAPPSSGWSALIPGVNPVPTIAFVVSTAQEVIDAVNDNDEVSALVTASASGTVTGAIAAVAATSLAGATAATTSKRKYRCPLGWTTTGGPYYCLMKKESPQLEDDTVIPVQSVGALKCAIQAVGYEYVNDEDRAKLCWANFDTFMKGSERQTHGPKRWTMGMDSSLKRKPRQFQ